jgi:hypothetical protein
MLATTHTLGIVIISLLITIIGPFIGLCKYKVDTIMRIAQFFILISLLTFTSTAYSGTDLRAEVMLDLIEGRFDHKTKNERLYALEYVETMLASFAKSVKPLSAHDKHWVEEKMAEIGKLQKRQFTEAMYSIAETPIFVQYKIENSLKNAMFAISKIKATNKHITEAYWWVKLSVSIRPIVESENWPKILATSNSAYVPIDKLRPALSIIKGIPSKIDLVLVRLLEDR